MKYKHCIRVLQRNRANGVYRDRDYKCKTCFMGIGSLIMEGEICHDLALPFTSWRTRKVDGIIQSKFKSLRTRVTDAVTSSLRLKACEGGGYMIAAGVKSQCPRAWKPHRSSSILAKEEEFPPPLPFCLFQVLGGLNDACPYWEGRLFFIWSPDSSWCWKLIIINTIL